MPAGIYPRTKEWKKKVYENLKRNKKISESKKESKNPNWKGDKAKYRAIHAWIKNHYGKANKCEECNEWKNKFVWANISGKYLRLREDYKMMCYSCHMNMDFQKIHKERDLKIKEMKEFKMKIKDIAKYFGVTRHTITNRLRKLNIIEYQYDRLQEE